MMEGIFSCAVHLISALISVLAADKQLTDHTSCSIGLENVSALHGVRLSIISENLCFG